MTRSHRLPSSLSGLRTGLLATLLLVLMVVPAAPAAADVSAGKVAGQLNDQRLYIASGASEAIPERSASDIRTELKQVSTPVYIVALPGSQLSGNSEFRPYTQKLVNQMNGPATVLVFDGQHYWAASNVIGDRANAAAQQAASANKGDQMGFMLDFPRQVQGFVDGNDGGATASTSGGGGFPWVGVVLLVIVLGGLGLYYGVSRSRRKQREAQELQGVRHAADEDVTKLGEDITALDANVRQQGLAEETRADYQHALDSYDAAKQKLAAAKRPEDLRPVSESLEDGRYAMTCVRARLAGEEPPERRAPCFFNPQHGPSATDMEWTPPGGTAREVPVCTADAERLRHGEEPHTREVVVNGQRRPYWDAGPGYAPWFGGYYGGFGMGGLLPGMLMGTMMGSALGGFGGDYGGGDFGGGGGDFGGGGGFGDFGGGGGDFGGGGF